MLLSWAVGREAGKFFCLNYRLRSKCVVGVALLHVLVDPAGQFLQVWPSQASAGVANLLRDIRDDPLA
jgi:hypothetical protein